MRNNAGHGQELPVTTTQYAYDTFAIGIQYTLYIYDLQVKASKLMKGLIDLYLSIDLASDYAVEIVTAGLPNIYC